MNKFKSLIFVDAVISVLIMIAIIVHRMFVEGQPFGFVVICIIVLLFLNMLFCIISLLAVSRGHSRIVSKLWLCVFSIIVFYFLVDLIGGFIFLGKTNSDIRSFVPDKIVHHRMPPDWIIRNYAPGNADVLLKTNSLGQLEIVSPEGNDKSKFRILMLGDSFTLGANVKNELCACYLLGKYLNDSMNNGYEVINLGVDSYAPILEYLQLKENIDTMKPDMVIMNVDMSDIVQEYFYRRNGKFDEEGEPLAVDGFTDYQKQKVTIKARFTNWVYQNLFITTVLIELLDKHFEKGVAVENLDLGNAVMRSNQFLLQHTLKDSSLSLEDFNKFMSMIEDSILRAKKLCDEYDAQFILTVYPWGHQVNDREWVPGKYEFLPESYEVSDRTVNELASFSKKDGIPFLNAFPDFRAYKGKEPLYYQHDMHFTPAGQELWAKSLDKFLAIYINEPHISDKH